MEEKDIKDKILNGARELFMKYGIRSVSMDDIARQLSVSKKTIYQYFADKDEIVSQVAMSRLENDKSQFDAIQKHAKNAVDELIGISVCLKKIIEGTNPSVLFDLQKYHNKAWTLWLEHKNNHIRSSVVRNLKQGIEEGFFRPELKPEILAAVRIELIQLAFNTDVYPPSQYNHAEVQLQLFEHFIYGLLTEKGRKQYEKFKQEPQLIDLIPNHA